MSVPETALRVMLAKGLSLADALEIADAWIEGVAKAVPSYEARIIAKRVADRERLRAKREAEEIARQSRDASATSGDKDAPVHEPARVRDISPKLVNNNNLTTPDGECAWPETDPPSKADLDRLQTALREAAGAALNAAAPRLIDLSPILRLARQGKGPPCDLNADVLPTIRARSARAPPGTVKSWDFFRDAITEARDRRLSGAPASEPQHERPNPRQDQPTARADRLGRSLAGLMAAVDEREGELGGRRARPGG